MKTVEKVKMFKVSLCYRMSRLVAADRRHSDSRWRLWLQESLKKVSWSEKLSSQTALSSMVSYPTVSVIARTGMLD